ncbi:hypothetical protein J5837_04930 [Pseudoxanthomonas helianthi]|uniref:Uncharacterized protein n=1 Tax=Pseudoxanthomonas helianthi TaxID=1453541 RepID=A0A940X0D4_9GAMM|nr:hypothetical protein [Pseudoxanthomonas helianthi]MBP3983765.1 hypothetical protein [Pseudoxanthomonas helianthi]
MSQIGVREGKFLSLMPARHHRAHEFCFFIHDQMARVLVEYESAGAHTRVERAFNRAAANASLDLQSFDLIDFLKEKDLRSLYEQHLLGHLVLGLTSDLCHFLYEALTAFEKRKFAVGYSLLRKPLKENLLFLCWILGSFDDFIPRFERDNYKSLNGVTKERQISIISSAIGKLSTGDAFDPEAIWKIIYSKNYENGLEPTWQRATHLITSKGDLLKTEDYTINFIFNDASDDRLYDRLYFSLPYALIFAVQVVVECFNRIQKVNENTYGHLVLSTLGCYEAMFLKGKSPIGRTLNKSLKGFLECCHCRARLKITKKNAVEIYLAEQTRCPSCNLLTPIPLYWIFSFSKLKILRD